MDMNALSKVTDDDIAALDEIFAKPEHSIEQVAGLIFQVEERGDEGAVSRVGLGLHQTYRGSEKAFAVFSRWVSENGVQDFDARHLWDNARLDHANPISLGSVIEFATDRGANRAPLDIECDDVKMRFNGTTVKQCPSCYINFPERGRGNIPVPNSQRNVEAFFEFHGIDFAYDEFARVYRVFGFRSDDNGIELDDACITDFWLGIKSYGAVCNKEFQQGVIENLARKNTNHPVRNYLSGLTWDGVTRLDTWMTTALGVDDTPLTRAIGRAFLVAAVKRVREPGCKFDNILVLEGPQGKGKSTAARVLASDDWFSDGLDVGADAKEVIEQTGGVWIAELPELSGMAKRDVRDVKKFAGRQDDVARLAYGRTTSKVKRQFVCIATTNDETYLRDDTGARRFWPVRCNDIDLAWLRDNRDSLWAEAAAAEAAGESTFLATHLWADAAAEQEKRRETSGAEDVLRDALAEGPTIGFIPSTVLYELLETTQAKADAKTKSLIKRVMAADGWEGCQFRSWDKSARLRGWKRGPVKEGDRVSIPFKEASRVPASPVDAVENPDATNATPDYPAWPIRLWCGRLEYEWGPTSPTAAEARERLAQGRA